MFFSRPLPLYATLLTIGIASLFCSILPAQTTISLSGAASATAHGYDMGDVVTITFTINNDFSDNVNSSFLPGGANWLESTTADDQLYLNIVGTGLTGSYTRPVSAFEEPQSWMSLSATDVFGLRAESDNAVNTGLFTPSGSAVTSIAFVDLFMDNWNPVNPMSYIAPGDFLSSLGGSYAINMTSNTIQLWVNGAEVIEFDPQGYSLLIGNTSAVPEPSTYALAVAIVAMGTVAYRRRKIA